MEVDRRRHDLPADLRQADQPVDRRAGARSQQSEHLLGGHRRELDAQQRLDRRRALQDHRRRRDLDQDGPAEQRAHLQDPGRSFEQRHRLRLRPRPAVERQRRARALQDHRRRQELVADPEGRQPLHRLLDPGDGSEEPAPPDRRDVGLPPHRLGLPLGRPERGRALRQRPARQRRRRGELDLAEVQPGAAQGSVGPRGGGLRAVEPERGLRLRRGGAQRPVPLRRRRQDLVRARPQPEHGVAPVLLRQPHGGSGQPRPGLQGRPQPDRQRGRRQELHLPRARQHAQRPPRPVDRPARSETRGRWRRRRPLHEPGRRQPLAQGRQPADQPVLSRQRRRQGSLPGLRRPAGQQRLGGRQRLSRRDHLRPLGEPGRRRRLLGLARSGRAGGLRLCREPGRRGDPRQPPHARGARHPAQERHQARSCASTGTRRSMSARSTRARSTSAPNTCSAAATTARAGTRSARTSPPTIRRSRSRKRAAASPSTTPPPRPTPPSTPSASRPSRRV